MKLGDAAVRRLQQVCDEPDLTDTPYRLDHKVGRGGMGTVYQVTDERLGRRVALKVLHSPDTTGEAAARMLSEAQVVAGLEHPGIVPIHDVGTLADGRVFYTMKLVEGTRLDRLPGTLSATPGAIVELLRVFQKTCEAVAFAHDRGVVHRDLKPENVMVGAFGEVLVMDWGLAKLLRDPESPFPPLFPEGPAAPVPGVTGPGVTVQGTVMGTPGYMAPEQARGEVDQIDERADVYALGVILSFLLTAGEASSPSAKTLPAGMFPVVLVAKDLVPGASKTLAAVYAKATAQDRDERYRDAAELEAEIRRLLDGLPVLAYRESWLERLQRFTYRYRTPILLVLTYLVIRALMLVFLGR